MTWVLLPESAPPNMDDAEVRNGAHPRASFWRDPVTILNRAFTHPRVLFCQHVPLAWLAFANEDPFFVYRHLANRDQGRHLVFHIEAGDQVAPAVGNPRIVDETGGMTIRSLTDQAAPVESSNTTSHAASIIVVPGGVPVARTLRIFEGFRPVASAVLEGTRHQDRINSDDGPAITRARLVPGTTILDVDTEGIESAFDVAWDTHRKVLAAWSALGLTNARSKTVTATAGAFVNAIDYAAHVYGAASAGLICPTAYVGRGIGTTVLASCYAYAEATAAAAGTVRFESGAAAGNIQDATIGLAKGWYAAAGKLALRTNVAGGGYEKVDVALDAVAAQTVRVWAWVIIEDP